MRLFDPRGDGEGEDGAGGGARWREELRHDMWVSSSFSHMFRLFQPPEKIVIGDEGKLCEASGGGSGGDGGSNKDEAKEGGAVWTGLACSSGVVRGRARVVHSLLECASVEQGEVLVAHYTDPSWTPVFALVTALVMENGGLLSHAAVVARELQLPCVVQVRDACAVIRTGDVVEVDGGAGVVRRVE